MAITDWPEAERPRERLLAQGARALSDAELLAVFLRVGIKGKSAVDLARDCIQRFGSLGRLFNAARADFSAIPGMGDAKYAQLQAVLEMARRTIESELRQDTAGLTSPQAVRDLLRLKLSALEYEVFMVLFLDTQNRLLAAEELFRGTIAQTAVYPREVVKRALAWNASAVVLAHNHPSGLPEPSGADHSITRTLRDALALVDVRTLDHFIVAGHQAISFAERGWL